MLPRRGARSLALAVAVSGLLALGCDDTFDPGYGDPPSICADCLLNPDALIQGLSSAYRTRNYDQFAGLFPAATDHASYFFTYHPAGGAVNWDLPEELRLHRRMFKPEDPLPGETLVLSDLWLNSTTITLARTSGTWLERQDLYRTEANPDGLDPLKWKATEAEYHADVLFDTVSENDFRVNGRGRFVVIEDLTKANGASRKFLIYRWEDLGNFSPKAGLKGEAMAGNRSGTAQPSWGQVKSLYK